MSGGHYNAGDCVEYGVAELLFPVDDLDATVYQYRDAELALSEVDDSAVVAVSPVSVATGYLLTQHVLTAIPVETLPAPVRAELDVALDAPIETFELVQIGKRQPASSNRSLAEFSD